MNIVAIYTAFAIFCAASLAVFYFCDVRRAIAIVFFGGWLLLPVGIYGPEIDKPGFAWWAIGLVLPSNTIIAKSWIVPVVALIGASIKSPKQIGAFRPGWVDLPMLCWCLWPLISGSLAPAPEPQPIIASLYVSASWGTTWLLGRIWFSTTSGRQRLVLALGLAGIACLPIAIGEGWAGPGLYEYLYGRHPFRDDGISRLYSYRPIGFFEHGNQYGVWTCMTALAAVWIAIALWEDRSARAVVVVMAMLGVAIALAAQSYGAIGLLIVGIVLLTLWRVALIRWAIPAFFIALAIGLIDAWCRGPELTPFARGLIEFGNLIGRSSLKWRLNLDLWIMLHDLTSPITGTGQWKWFPELRPWDLPILAVGQFGVIGSALIFGCLLIPVFSAILGGPARHGWSWKDPSIVLGIIVILALCDTFFNTFFFFPAILCAGAVARNSSQPKGARS